MKILIIPDIHEQYDALEKIAQSTIAYEAEKIVCLGDYLDSFKHNIHDCRKVLEFLSERKDDPKWTFLLGNHDIHYHFDRKMTCSGFQRDSYELWQEFKQAERLPHFAPFCVVGKNYCVLLSHAGVDKRLGVTGTNALFSQWELFRAGFTPNVFEQIGRERGGSHDVGGPFWQDFAWLRPDMELETLNGVVALQIVGHTNGKHVQRITRGNGSNEIELAICLDDNLRSVMMLETLDSTYQLHSVSELEAYEPSESGPGDNVEEQPVAGMGEGESPANAA